MIYRLISLTERLLIVMLSILVITILVKREIYAQEFISTPQQIQITVEDGGDAWFRSDFSLINNDPEDLIGGYEFIFPSINPKNVVVTLNGNQVPVQIDNVPGSNLKKLILDLSSYPIKSGETKQVIVSARIENLVKTFQGIRFIDLVFSGDIKSGVYVNLPSRLGETVVLNDDYQETKTNQIYSENPSSLFILFGNEYIVDISTKFILRNDTGDSFRSIYSLIPAFSSQESVYKEIYNSEYGLSDQYGNFFAATSVNPGQEKEVGFEARVKKTNQPLEILAEHTVNIPINENNKYYSPLSKIADKTTQLETLKSAYNLLVKSASPTVEKFDYLNVENTWERIDNKDSLNSFEYCFILSSFAQSHGIKSEIRYGYRIVAENVNNQIAPNFWCVFDVDGKTVLADPFQEAVSGLPYFGLESEIDRITMGSWNTDELYNNALGMLSSVNATKIIELTALGKFDDSSETVELNVVQPNEIFSGFIHNLDLEIQNNTNKIIKTNQFEYLSKDFTHSLYITDDLKLALLPNQINYIKVGGLRKDNFFYTGEDNVEVKLTLEDSAATEAKTTVKIKFVINKTAFIFGAGAILLVLVLAIIVLWRILIPRRR